MLGWLALVPLLTAQQPELLSWEALSELPAGPGQQVQPGVAGAYSGQHSGALIIAGGTNFPEALPAQPVNATLGLSRSTEMS